MQSAQSGTWKKVMYVLYGLLIVYGSNAIIVID
jgi:hypothetical protein